jgi:hypothetical protein
MTLKMTLSQSSLENLYRLTLRQFVAEYARELEHGV